VALAVDLTSATIPVGIKVIGVDHSIIAAAMDSKDIVIDMIHKAITMAVHHTTTIEEDNTSMTAKHHLMVITTTTIT